MKYSEETKESYRTWNKVFEIEHIKGHFTLTQIGTVLKRGFTIVSRTVSSCVLFTKYLLCYPFIISIFTLKIFF